MKARFEDILPGDELPVLERQVTAETLVRYAGAADDYVYLHWNHPRVIAEGYDDVIVHGWLTCAYMVESVTRIVPREIADIEHFAIRYRATLHPGRLRCGGVVREKHAANGKRTMEFDLWAKNDADVIAAEAGLSLIFP